MGPNNSLSKLITEETGCTYRKPVSQQLILTGLVQCHSIRLGKLQKKVHPLVARPLRGGSVKAGPLRKK